MLCQNHECVGKAAELATGEGADPTTLSKQKGAVEQEPGESQKSDLRQILWSYLLTKNCRYLNI